MAYTSYLALFARYRTAWIKLLLLTGGATLTNSFSETSENIAISHRPTLPRNSSGDEIANVNFLSYRYRTRTTKQNRLVHFATDGRG